MRKVLLRAVSYEWECPKGHCNETHEVDYEPFEGDHNIVKCEECFEKFSCEYD